MRIYVSWIENIDVCDRKRPYAVIDDRKGNVFISDIFLFRNKLLFSYNLWYVKLTADRKNVANYGQYMSAIAAAFVNIPDDMLINRIKEFFSLTNKTILFKPDDTYLEFESKYYIREDLVKKKFGNIVRKLYGDNVYFLEAESPFNIEEILYKLGAEDIKILVSFYDIFDLPDASYKITEIIGDKFRDTKNNTIDDLHFIALFYRICICLVMRFAYYMSYRFKPPNIYVYFISSSIYGFESIGDIYIGVELNPIGYIYKHEEKVIETFMHEYSHYIGSILYGSASDISIEFEKAYTKTMTYYIDFIQKEGEYVAAIRRGLYLVNTTKNYMSFISDMKPISYHVEKVVNELFVELRSMGFNVDLPYIRDYIYTLEVSNKIYGIVHLLFTFYVVYKDGMITKGNHPRDYDKVLSEVLLSSINSGQVLCKAIDKIEKIIIKNYTIPTDACVIMLYPNTDGWERLDKAGYQYRIIR